MREENGHGPILTGGGKRFSARTTRDHVVSVTGSRRTSVPSGYGSSLPSGLRSGVMRPRSSTATIWDVQGASGSGVPSVVQGWAMSSAVPRRTARPPGLERAALVGGQHPAEVTVREAVGGDAAGGDHGEHAGAEESQGPVSAPGPERVGRARHGPVPADALAAGVGDQPVVPQLDDVPARREHFSRRIPRPAAQPPARSTVCSLSLARQGVVSGGCKTEQQVVFRTTEGS